MTSNASPNQLLSDNRSTSCCSGSRDMNRASVGMYMTFDLLGAWKLWNSSPRRQCSADAMLVLNVVHSGAAAERRSRNFFYGKLATLIAVEALAGRTVVDSHNDGTAVTRGSFAIAAVTAAAMWRRVGTGLSM